MFGVMVASADWLKDESQLNTPRSVFQNKSGFFPIWTFSDHQTLSRVTAQKKCSETKQNEIHPQELQGHIEHRHNARLEHLYTFRPHSPEA